MKYYLVAWVYNYLGLDNDAYLTDSDEKAFNQFKKLLIEAGFKGDPHNYKEIVEYNNSLESRVLIYEELELQ